MKLVLDMTEYSVHGAREALNVSLAQYDPLMVVVAAMATCFLLSIATSAVNSAVLVLSDDGLKSTLTMIAFRFIKYIGGNKSEGHFSLVNEAYSIFSHTNPLHPDVFPSIPQFEAQVAAMTAAMLGSKTKSSGGQVCGNITSGGTESILMAVKSTWDFMKATHGITAPEMIIPESAHSAYDKAAQYFQIKLQHAPVTSEFCADVKAIRRLINKNTIMIVRSSPGFSHGVIDPIQEIAALALQFGICVHVNLCLGGFILPFARKLGCPLPPLGFQVPGVTSISMDVHKYGLAQKGTSIVLYRNHEL